MNDMFILKGYVEKAEETEGLLDASVASNGIVDRDGEAINQDGWDIKSFKKNPQLLWAHNVREARPPIGKVTKIWFEGEGKSKVMKFKAMFDMADDFAKDIWRKYKEGFLNAFSVGFIPLEREGSTYTKAELLEISAVPVPANPAALVEIRAKGMEGIEWGDLTKKEEVKEEVEEEPKEEIKEVTYTEAQLKEVVREAIKEYRLIKEKDNEYKELDNLRDALRMVAQSVNIALRNLKERGGDK